METIEKLLFGEIPPPKEKKKHQHHNQHEKTQASFARSGGSGGTTNAQILRQHASLDETELSGQLNSSYVSSRKPNSSYVSRNTGSMNVAQQFHDAFLGEDNTTEGGTEGGTEGDTSAGTGAEIEGTQGLQIVGIRGTPTISLVTDSRRDQSLRSDYPDASNQQELGESGYSKKTWTAAPYKREILEKKFSSSDPGKGRRVAVLSALRKLGIKVYVIDGTTAQSTHSIMSKIRLVAREVARENSVQPWTGPLGYLRCILYQDEQGRLFNLSFPCHAVGPLARWQEYLDSFSSTQAMIVLMILCRSFPCAKEESLNSLQPAYLSLILGLVFAEEVGLSGLNAVMLVRCAPSVSAHFMMSTFGPDFLRKAVIFILAVGAASSGKAQQVMTLLGITGACMALLANMGARAWHFLRWEPMSYSGPGATMLAYMLAVLTGAALPLMSHRTVAAGGKGAMESIIQSALVVAFCFILSDLDNIQRLLVVGSEDCNQEYVNVIGALWWTITFICSLVLVRRIPFNDVAIGDGERLLDEDHTSPVGYKVPKLPDFIVDPVMSKEGNSWFSVNVEFAFGIFFAVTTGFAMAAFTLSNWEDSLVDKVDGYAVALKDDFN